MHLTEAPAAEPEKKKREYKDMEEKKEGDLHARVDMNTVSRALTIDPY